MGRGGRGGRRSAWWSGEERQGWAQVSLVEWGGERKEPSPLCLLGDFMVCPIPFPPSPPTQDTHSTLIHTCGQLPELEVLHRSRGHERLLRVVQDEALHRGGGGGLRNEQLLRVVQHRWWRGGGGGGVTSGF